MRPAPSIVPAGAGVRPRPTLVPLVLLFVLLPTLPLFGLAPEAGAQEVPHAPDRGADEGEGPYERLVIRGATVVDGTGAPPRGPMEVVVEGDRITRVAPISASDMPDERVGSTEGAERVIDARGMYLLPGLVDLHAHIHAARPGTSAEYQYKLWMAHGITTIRDPGSGSGLEWSLEEQARSERDEIVAPRIFVYAGVGSGWDRGRVDTPRKAREWVRWLAERGADGIKIRDTYDPDVAAAILDEAAVHGLGTAAHLTQMGVAEFDALDAARAGLGTLEHWYGLPEALFDDRTVQDFPPEYDYGNEYDRFREAGRLWKQAARRGSERYETVMTGLLERGLVLNPTFTIYEANRDVMRAREAEWHERYTVPSLWAFFQPSPESHGSYWFRWSTGDEIAWKRNFRLWMDFVDDYKDRGGAVCTGSDSGYIYKLYGFGYIRELELLQEAGFHPLEVIRAATQCGARALARPAGREPELGVVRAGRLADLVLVGANPIHDLKVLYGTGAVRLDEESGEVRRVGGVRYTIKNGIVYDARRLLEDVAGIVAEAKAAGPSGNGDR